MYVEYGTLTRHGYGNAIPNPGSCDLPESQSVDAVFHAVSAFPRFRFGLASITDNGRVRKPSEVRVFAFNASSLVLFGLRLRTSVDHSCSSVCHDSTACHDSPEPCSHAPHAPPRLFVFPCSHAPPHAPPRRLPLVICLIPHAIWHPSP